MHLYQHIFKNDNFQSTGVIFHAKGQGLGERCRSSPVAFTPAKKTRNHRALGRII